MSEQVTLVYMIAINKLCESIYTLLLTESKKYLQFITNKISNIIFFKFLIVKFFFTFYILSNFTLSKLRNAEKGPFVRYSFIRLFTFISRFGEVPIHSYLF